MSLEVVKHVSIPFNPAQSKRQSYWNILHFRTPHKHMPKSIPLPRDRWLGTHRKVLGGRAA